MDGPSSGRSWLNYYSSMILEIFICKIFSRDSWEKVQSENHEKLALNFVFELGLSSVVDPQDNLHKNGICDSHDATHLITFHELPFLLP